MRDKNRIILRIVTWSLVAILLSVFLISNLQESVNVFSGNVFSSMNYMEGKNMKTIKEYKFDNIDDIKNITANISTSDIVFRKNDENNIKVIVKSNRNLKDKDFVKANVSSDTLKIEDTERRTRVNLFGINKGFYVDIQILLPKNYNGNLDVLNKVGDVDFVSNFNLNNVTIDNKVGDVDISNKLKANKVLFDCKVGSVEANILDVENLIINANTGDAEINQFSGKGNIETELGDVEINIQKLNGNLDIEAGLGDIDIVVNSNESFNFKGNKNYEDIDSNLQFDNVSLSSKSFNGKYGSNPKNTISVKSNAGEISINN